MPTKRYKDMTPVERKAAYDEQVEAVEVHVQCFALRPPRGSFWDRKAERHMVGCQREADFIIRVAKSLGDEWAK